MSDMGWVMRGALFRSATCCRDPDLELEVEAGEYTPFGLAVTLVEDGVLRLHEGVDHRTLRLKDLAETEPQRNGVVVSFEIVGLDSRRAQVPPLAQLIESEGLQRRDVDIGAVVVARDAHLPGQQVAPLELRVRRIEQNVGEAERPLLRPERVVRRRRYGDLRAEAEAHCRIACVEQVGSEEIDIAKTRLVIAASLRKRVHRNREARDPVAAERLEWLGIAQEELVGVAIGARQIAGVLVLEVQRGRAGERVVGLRRAVLRVGGKHGAQHEDGRGHASHEFSVLLTRHNAPLPYPMLRSFLSIQPRPQATFAARGVGALMDASFVAERHSTFTMSSGFQVWS